MRKAAGHAPCNGAMIIAMAIFAQAVLRLNEARA